MKKVFFIINPNDVKEAKKHLDTILEGKYILPTVFKMDIASEKLDSTIDSIEYILAGIDFEVVINEKFSEN